MADNKKPDMPDKAEQPVLDNNAVQDTPTLPNLTAEEAATLAHEGAAASAPEKSAPDKEPTAPARQGRPKSEKAPEAPAAGDNRPPWEKPLSELEPPAKKRGQTSRKRLRPEPLKKRLRQRRPRLPPRKRRPFPVRPPGLLKRNRLSLFPCRSSIRSRIILLVFGMIRK